MADNKQINQLISTLSRRMNADEGEIRSALAQGKYDKLLSKMNQSQLNQIQTMLNDENEAKKFLSSPQAQAVMKKLGFNG